MLNMKSNRFTVYFSKRPEIRRRLRLVAQAVIEVAKRLHAEIEFKMVERTLSIVVYYSMKELGTFQVYCDWGKNWSIDEVYFSIMSIINALSVDNRMLTPA